MEIGTRITGGEFPRRHRALIFLSVVIMATALLIVVPAPVEAASGGILHVFPPVVNGRAYPVARPIVLRSVTQVTVSESSVEYRTDQAFYNDNDKPVKGVFIVPLPPEPLSDAPEVLKDGIRTRFTLWEAEEFFPTLRKYVTEMKDPSLLELAGKKVLTVGRVTVPARGHTTFKVKHRRSHSIRDEYLDLTVGVQGERYSISPVARLTITVRFKMSRSVRAVFSPSHHFELIREAPHRCSVVVEQRDKPVRRDFRLVTTFSGDPLDVRAFSYRRPDAEGYFMILISPPVTPERSDEPPKDVVIVVDRSQSMGPEYLEYAKRAAIFCLERLNPADRFAVWAVGTRPRTMNEKLTRATRENVEKAVERIESWGESGGTDLYNGLLNALSHLESRRRRNAVVYIGDGRPTVGVTDPETIIEDVKRFNRLHARFFVAALGGEVDAALLDRLAGSTRGLSAHFDGTEDFTTVMRKFFSAVSPPRVSRVDLDFENLSPEDVHPSPIPDLFGDRTLAVFGRYSAPASKSARLRVKAHVGRSTETVTRFVQFPRVDERFPFIANIWAMRRCGALLEKDRVEGPNAQLRKRIRSLAHTYGFHVPGEGRLDSLGRAIAIPVESVGPVLWNLKTSNVSADVRAEEYRYLKGKVFHLRDGRWVDSLYRPAAPTLDIAFLSENYFSIVEDAPDIGPYLALGPKVTVVRGGTAISIGAEPFSTPRNNRPSKDER